MSKRITALLLCVLLCLCVFAGCGNDKQQGSSGTSKPASSQAQNSEPAASNTGTDEEHPYRITDEPVTLKIWTVKPSCIADWETNAYIKWLEEETGVELEFEQAPEVDSETALNLSLASGDYPDIYWATMTNSILTRYGSSGIFVPMNDYIDQYGDNVKRWFSEISWLEGGCKSPDGNIYGLPDYNGMYHVSLSQKMWIDESWLTNLNLEMPTTLDEFRDVLRAFKEKDANGNGDPNDEIPLTGIANYWRGDFSNFIMCSFIYDDGDKRMTVTNDNVDTIVNKEEYKNGLKYMAEMYAEGLINPESWSADGDQVKNLTAGNLVGCITAGHLLSAADTITDMFLHSTTVPPLKGPDGVQTCGYYGNSHANENKAVITSACENPEIAFKLLDVCYSTDASMRARKGEFGVDWGYAEEGEKTCDGRDAVYKALSTYTGAGNVEQNQHIDNFGLWAETNDMAMALWTCPEEFDVHDTEYFEQLLYLETKKYDGYQPEQTLPPIAFTDEEWGEISTIEVDIKEYVDQQRALFISGQKDIDAEWDAYVQQLESMGINKLVETYDMAYKRQYVQ